MLTRKTLLQNKIESVYGVAPAMLPADSLLISNLDISVDPTQLERDVYRDTLSAFGTRVGKKIMTCSFDVELKGLGVLPTLAAPIEQDAVLRACGLVASDHGDGVEYTPTSDEALQDSVSLKFNLDGQQYLMRGCYGNVSANLVAGAFGVLSFNFTGLYTTPTDVAQIQPVYVNDTEPPIVENLSFLLDSYAGIAETLMFDLGNEVSERPDLNSPEGLLALRITNRNMTGSVDPEMVAIATKDFWTIFEESTKKEISCTVGATLGNIFDITIPAIQLTNIGLGDRNGIRVYALEYLATGDDDEIALKAR